MKRIVLCFFLLLPFLVKAQNLVNITSVTVKNQLPATVYNWGSIPGSLLLTAQSMGQRSAPSCNLVLQIKRNGSLICGNTGPTGIPIDSFKIKTLTTNQLLAAFSSCNVLQPGSYTLCAFFWSKGESISSVVCREFNVVADSAQSPRPGAGTTLPGGSTLPNSPASNIVYTGPQPIAPINGKQFSEMEAKGIFTFEWRPVMPKPAGSVTYLLQIFEIAQGSTATQAVKGIPVFTKEVRDINRIPIPANQLQLKKDISYAWNVQAVNNNRQAQGGGNTNYGGASEAWSFSVTSPYQVSLSIKVDSIYCLGKDTNGKYKYHIRLKIDNDPRNNPTGSISDISPILFFDNLINYNQNNQSGINNSSHLIQVWNPGLNGLPGNPKLGYSIAPDILTPYPNIIPSNTEMMQELIMTVPSPPSFPIIIRLFSAAANQSGDSYNTSNVNDTIKVLPPCPCDFCDELNWGEKPGSAQLAVDKNVANINQSFSIVGVGIKQVKADIIGFDWRVNEDCKKCLKDSYGYFLGGKATGQVPNADAIFPSTKAGPLMNSNELQWNICANQKAASFNGTLNMSVALPPQTSLSCCTDEFKICVRYTIVTEDCRTCTKVLCYSLSRTHGSNSKPVSDNKNNQSN